jgi:hypothetical protein
MQYETGVCRIERLNPKTGEYVFYGTGFLYSTNSRIATNSHVIPDYNDLLFYRAVFQANGQQIVRILTYGGFLMACPIIDFDPNLFQGVPGQ